MTKRCPACKTVKDASEFYKAAKIAGGLGGYCKVCTKVRKAEWSKQNPEKVRAHQIANRKRNWKDQYRRKKQRREQDLPAWRAKYLANYQKHKTRIIARQRLKRQTNLGFRLSRSLSQRLTYAFRADGIRKTRNGQAVELLGCSMESFKIYIESKFQEGMTFENYGKVWELDHIMPCAIFDLTKSEHQKRCFHVSNYQPLFVTDNRQKSAKVLTPQFPLI